MKRIAPSVLAVLGSIGVAATFVGPARAHTSPVDAILSTAGNYIRSYERDVTAVVAQEDYIQRVTPFISGPRESLTRLLRSDLIMIADEASGWVEYRDVFEVDTHKVRDHDDRIANLFLKPNPNARAQAARIVDESARFNLSPNGVTFKRTLNIPMTALRFLRRQNQSRSAFQIDREEKTDASPLVVLRFKEQATPRLIGTSGQAAATGAFWIDPSSGAVVRTELRLSTRTVVGEIKVSYAQQLEPPIWLPASMDELYNVTEWSLAISGKATYSNFRRFRVDVSTEVK
jgi:hypothetical protein